jgi:hypothetical protein
MGMAAADENEILSDRNALLHRLHYARAARVDRLRHPRGRPAGLPERPFSNGLPRCFCCFCRKLSADINFCSAEILELGPRGPRENSGPCPVPIIVQLDAHRFVAIKTQKSQFVKWQHAPGVAS